MDQPFTLEDSGIAMHEIFLSLVKGGFTEPQALTIITEMLRESMKGHLK